MTIDAALGFYMNHLPQFIEMVFVVALMGAIVLLVNAFREEKTQVLQGASQFSQLEETLRKVLDSAKTANPSSASAAVGLIEDEEDSQKPAAAANVSNEGLREKDREITQLKELITQLEKRGKDGGSGDKSADLEKKLKGLEEKLAEYEIIEDDIANLSTYKEENSRLKEELDRMRREGAPANMPLRAAEAAASGGLPVAGEDVVGDDLMAEFEKAIRDQKSSPDPVAPPAAIAGSPAKVVQKTPFSETIESSAGTGPDAESVNDDLMAEFAAALDDQTATKSVTATSVDEPIMDLSATQEPVISELTDNVVMGDFAGGEPEAVADFQDLEIQSAADNGRSSAAAPQVQKSPVADRQPTVAVAPSPIAEEEVAGPSALNIKLDAETMVAEVNVGAAPKKEEDPNMDETERLLSEFEDFVKGTGS